MLKELLCSCLYDRFCHLSIPLRHLGSMEPTQEQVSAPQLDASAGALAKWAGLAEPAAKSLATQLGLGGGPCTGQHCCKWNKLSWSQSQTQDGRCDRPRGRDRNSHSWPRLGESLVGRLSKRKRGARQLLELAAAARWHLQGVMVPGPGGFQVWEACF